MWGWLLCLAAAVLAADGAGAGAARLVCYVESARATEGFSECTHLVYAGDARGDKLDALLKEYRKNNPRLKIVLRVNDGDADLSSLLKSKHVQGLEIYDAHKSLNQSKILETVEAARSAINTRGGGPLFLALPAHAELLAKYYDLRTLVKKVDLMMVQTHALGFVKKMTYHPSRLSGLWDMMNTDSVVDLVVGLGVPASKVVISLPATARKFTLLNETLSTPGSPTLEDEPKEIGQAELCRMLQKGRWTLERDQDLSGPYAFKNTTWVAFEDSSSVDVKGKYARVRGLAGLALAAAERDLATPCGLTLKAALAKVLNQQSRAPRAAVLRSLEHEILSGPANARAFDALQVSPYRITQVVDSDGVIHSIREDTRTEFTCSRQGYFVHPRSCARFYRCVKFDQLSPEYTVFEFDCPAGLAFDSSVEVCVWPGSLPDGHACPGSSEIAPVPQTRFVCPDKEGYYADPENCRWFFACLDHGTSPLAAYEFRCPFGLGFDAERLRCDWPWAVPACGQLGRYEASARGFEGAVGYHGQTADAINVAAHQSLVSGASLNNLVGIQSGFLTSNDALDANFISSQEYADGAQNFGQRYNAGQAISSDGEAGNVLVHQIGEGGSYQSNIGLVQPIRYSNDQKYTSGSLILDDYRLPTKGTHGKGQNLLQVNAYQGAGQYNNGYSQSYASGNAGNVRYENSNNYDDQSGAYVHDPTGDHAEPYNHDDAPAVPYKHDNSDYKQSSDYYDYNRYSGASQSDYNGKYSEGNGQYVQDNSGSYVDSASSNDFSGSYNADYSGSYSHDDSGKYLAGVYRADGHIGNYQSSGSSSSEGKAINQVNINQYHGAYSASNSGNYLTDSKAYTGASHTLTAGAVNVGLVGKTSLVDAGYTDQSNYNANSGYNFGSTVSHGSVNQYVHPGQVSYISQPAVSIHHLGTDNNNLDGYAFVTTPTSSGVPTTATPFAATNALPTVTYVSEAPKTSIKQIFGIRQPAVTYVTPASLAVTPKVEITDYNEAAGNADYSYASQHSSQSSGYEYSKPTIKFEDGITYTTQAPAISVSTYKPQGFSHGQQTLHNQQSIGIDYSTASPVNEPQFKKLVAYTTGPSVSIHAQPTLASIPQSFSHQTIHKVETSNSYNPQLQVAIHEQQPIVQYTTAQPAVVSSTYQPQVFSHQLIHQVDASKVNTYNQNSDSGYVYQKPEVSGYQYEAPKIKFEEAPETVVQYSTPAPVVSTYRPQSFSHQTIHKAEYVPVTARPTVQISYQQPTVSTYENPILKYKQEVTPITYTEQKYTPQSYSHQTIHKAVESKAYTPTYQQPTIIQYTTPQPAIALQPIVSTYQPQVISHQTLHNVETSKVKTYSENQSGYEYQKPLIKYEEGPKTVIQYSTAAPVTNADYKPHAYSHQTVHNIETQNYTPVSSTVAPQIELSYQPAVSVYENPLLKYTVKDTYVKPVTYTPIVQQQEITHIRQPVQYEQSAQQSYSHQNTQFGQEGYTYSQPEIQRNYESLSANKYSDASVVSHQVFHQEHAQVKPEKDVVFVSSTPATLAYEDHYVEYETPKKVEYKSREYIPPKTEYQQTYSVVSTASTPIVQHQSEVIHQNQYINDFKSIENSRSSEQEVSAPVQHISFSTSHVTQPRKESFHVSTFPGSSVVTKYKQIAQETPQVQVAYQAEEYLPPVASTPSPTTYSTTSREYLPPVTEQKYYVKSTYLPPSTTARPIVKTQPPTYSYVQSTTPYQAPDYLPPIEENGSKTVYFDSFGIKNDKESSDSNIEYKPYQQYDAFEHNVVSSTYAPVQRKENVVVQSLKSNLLGFGTVGPDAGLVSPIIYTTSAPVVSTTYRPIVKSTTGASSYKYIESTPKYQAPEYLPPQEETDNYESYGYKNVNPYNGSPQRKQNIVVETAKQQAGYNTGIYSTSAPVVSSSETYSSAPIRVTTQLPYKQELVEVTPYSQSTRRLQPKVAVVTKINDFNPFLVRKLGAVCSCQSPVLVLKGKRPNVPTQQDFNDYSTDYEDVGRGDVNDYEWAQKSAKLRLPAAKRIPIVSSTINPIIVPDDSYYQDLEEDNYSGKEIISESFVSSTPAIYSTTQKSIRIRPRVKAVTVAPTYKTVLLNQEVASYETDKQRGSASVVDSQSFDRYGPGGWRSRDETLQGSVDCQRAGLFRHPKQCNKFYACRWDCTKQRFTLHVFNCPIQLSFDESLGACNWPSQGPACQGDTLLTNTL